jgi:HPt (histidine-containing phosphotransfer) domain-containing protein
MATLCADDPDLIREMLGEFVAVSRSVCNALAQAMAQGVTLAVKDCAHNLKGSSRTAGARPLAEAARRLESAAAGAAGTAELAELAARVQEEMDRVARHVAEL